MVITTRRRIRSRPGLSLLSSRRLLAPGCALLIAGFIAGTPASGQYRLDAVGRPVFASRAQLVLVPVTVTDSKGATVNGLSRDAFALSEDKVTRPITSFSEEDDPVSIGVIFDASGSMRESLDGAKTSLRTFLQTCNPDDEAFLDVVSTRPARVSGLKLMPNNPPMNTLHGKSHSRWKIQNSARGTVL